MVACLRRRLVVPMMLLAAPLFYVWSLHSSARRSSSRPLPFSYYNTMDCCAALLAFTLGALVALGGENARRRSRWSSRWPCCRGWPIRGRVLDLLEESQVTHARRA
jgi:hypothetical protein